METHLTNTIVGLKHFNAYVNISRHGIPQGVISLARFPYKGEIIAPRRSVGIVARGVRGTIMYLLRLRKQTRGIELPSQDIIDEAVSRTEAYFSSKGVTLRDSLVTLTDLEKALAAFRLTLNTLAHRGVNCIVPHADVDDRVVPIHKLAHVYESVLKNPEAIEMHLGSTISVDRIKKLANFTLNVNKESRRVDILYDGAIVGCGIYELKPGPDC